MILEILEIAVLGVGVLVPTFSAYDFGLLLLQSWSWSKPKSSRGSIKTNNNNIENKKSLELT